MSNLQKEKEREKLGERERNRKCVSEEERDWKNDYTRSKQMMVMEGSIETSSHAQRPSNTHTHKQT